MITGSDVICGVTVAYMCLWMGWITERRPDGTEGVDESVIRSHLEEYQKHHITYLRDGGDALLVSLRARAIAPEYGITYRTPVLPFTGTGITEASSAEDLIRWKSMYVW